MSYLKNSPQSVYFALISATDGSAMTGESPSAYVSIDQAAQASAAGSVTELANGQYRFDGTADDFNGDEIGLLFAASGAVPVSITIKTDTAAVGTVNTAIAALNDLSAAEAQSAADAAITNNEFIKIIRAFAAGNVDIDGSTYTFYHTDGTTPLYVLTIASNGRTTA